MNLVIKSFVVALLAVSSVNAASIRGIRQAPSWWSTHDAVEACTSIGSNRECSRCATDGLRLCLNNSDEDAAVCDRFFENTIARMMFAALFVKFALNQPSVMNGALSPIA